MKPNSIYQIYLRTFTGEGTLKSAEKMLPHIADLGIDTVYLSALNKEDDSAEGQSKRQLESKMNNTKNPYRITDYFDVDEEFGTMDDLKSFVKTAHKCGLKVLIDLVYLHCGPNAVFIKDNPDFVVRDENGEIKLGEGWPFARLNYENPDLRQYLWSNMEFYIRDVDADGFRCDVGDALPLDFWEEGFRRVKKIKPDVFTLDEGSSADYLPTFDAVYGFEVIHAIGKMFGHEKNSGKKQRYIINDDDNTVYTASEFVKIWKQLHENVPLGKTISNAENHDVASDTFSERLENHIGSNGADAINVLVFTLDGIPMIYNGNEVADNGLKNMFWNRFCSGSMSVQWENLATVKGKKRMSLIKELIRIRKGSKAISEGSLEWLEHSNEENVLVFSRTSGDETVNVIINITSQIQSTRLNNSAVGDAIIFQNAQCGKDEITLLPYGFAVCEVSKA